MLVLKKELDLEDFTDLFSDELDGIGEEGVSLIFDSICETSGASETETGISDYLRYQLQHMSVGEVVDDYGYGFDGIDLEDLEDPETLEAIEEYLCNNTYVIGKYEEDGETFFIFDEF